MRYPIIDGFDHYPATTGQPGALDSDWTCYAFQANGFALGLGGENQSVQMNTSGSFSGYQRSFPDANKLTFHFGCKLTSMVPGNFVGNQYISFETSAGSHQFGLTINAAGQWQVKGENNLVVATGEIPMIPNQVYRNCIQADLTNGTFRMSINGDDDPGLHQTGLDLQDDPSSNMCGILKFRAADSNTIFYDDFILGIDECVDWGPLEINTLPVTADVAAGFTKSGGATNFGNVDELPFTGDTDYNYASVVGTKDVFEFANPPRTPDSILCVQLITLARKEESALRKIKEIIRIGGVDYEGSEHTLAETYGRFVSQWVTNPATGLAWTAAELNALQGGYLLSVAA